MDDFQIVRSPLVLITQDDEGKTVTRIHPAPGHTHKHYGLLIADLVRHVALAFKVDDADVWEWVDKERRRPTTKITRPC